jgi:hypothetical protein
MNPIQQILEHKLVVALTVIGGIVFTLWEPITNIFYTGYFHTNVVLDMSAESIPLDKNKDLLIVHIIPKNKGNVPLVIKDKESFKLEIRQIDKLEDLKWIEPSTLKQISKINVLRNTLTEKDDTYTLETNGDYEEIESIPLPHGIYWINSSLEYSDGVVNQSEIVKVPIK